MREDIGSGLLVLERFDDDGFDDVEVSPIVFDKQEGFREVPAIIDDDFESFELELVEELYFKDEIFHFRIVYMMKIEEISP